MAVLHLRSRAEEHPADFDHPVALLLACHERVRHFAALVPKLAEHLRQTGCDQAAREAAAGILRYFDLAAQLHHQDEEFDVFPALRVVLRQPADARLLAAIDRMEAEHAALATAYGQVRPALAAIAAGQGVELEAVAAQGFAELYPAHAQAEEEEVFAFLEAKLGAASLADIGRKMAARRGVTHG
jgi:hemerythrin-like domain-containing protein